MTDTKLDGLIAARVIFNRTPGFQYMCPELDAAIDAERKALAKRLIGEVVAEDKIERAIAAERKSAEVQTGVSRPVILTDEEIAHLQDCQTNLQKPTPSILEAAQLMKDMYPEPPAKRKSADGREVGDIKLTAMKLCRERANQAIKNEFAATSELDATCFRSIVDELDALYRDIAVIPRPSPIPPAKESAQGVSDYAVARKAAFKFHPNCATPSKDTIEAAAIDLVDANRLEVVRTAMSTSNTAFRDYLGKARAVLTKLDAFDAALRAKPDAGAFAEDMATALEGMVHLAEMGLEESLREPEENGNYAAYNRAIVTLARYRAAYTAPGDQHVK